MKLGYRPCIMRRIRGWVSVLCRALRCGHCRLARGLCDSRTGVGGEVS